MFPQKPRITSPIPTVTDPEKPALNDLLANFALGPAWARGQDDSKAKRPSSPKGRGRGDRDRDPSGPGPDKFRKGKRPFAKQDSFRPKRDDTPPATGVRVTILPDIEAVHLIVKEVHQVARCYSLFDVATTLLHKRERCRAVFELKQSLPPFWRAKSGDALYLTREEAQAHLWHGGARAEFLDEETVEVDPPSGNFQAVAQCGLSGKWLGPPNFHTYQTELRRLHRERFSHMPFEAYSAKVRTERGEEAVNAWLATMTKKTRWRPKGGTSDDAWVDDPSQAQRLLSQLALEQCFEQTHRAELPASASGHQLSAPLRVSLKLGFNHAHKHPAMLIPSICKALESDHLPVFKRQGKLYTGPVRPNPLPKDATLAPRPGQMIEWIRAHTPGAKLEGLWQAVLPEGSTAPPADYAADLFWLLQQGHILLFTDDTLMVQEPREIQPPKKKAAKPKKQGAPQTGETEDKPTLSGEEAPPSHPEEAPPTPSQDPSPLEVGMTAQEAEEIAELSPEPPSAAVEETPLDEPEDSPSPSEPESTADKPEQASGEEGSPESGSTKE